MSEVDIERGVAVQEFRSSPEQINHAEVLQELFTASDEVIAACRPKLWTAAEKVAATVINPDQQRAVAVYAGVLDWHWFGKPHDPTPEGMVVTSHNDSLGLSLDRRIPYINDQLGFLDGQLNQVGLRKAIEPYLDEVEARKPEVTAVVTDFILNSAQYKLLASFDDPQNKPETAPLNSYWRQIREQQVEGSLRERYGYSPDEQLPPDSPLHHELRLRRHQLDIESLVQPQSAKGSQDALRRARAYLTPYVAKEYEDGQVKRSDPHEFGDIYYDPGNGLYIRYKGEEEGEDAGVELWDYARDAGWSITEKTYTGPEDLDFIAADFVGNAIEKILDPRAGGKYSDILQAAVDSTIELAIERLYDVVRASGSGLSYSHEEPGTMLLRKPHGEIVDWQSMYDLKFYHRRLKDEDWSVVFRSKSDISTAAEIEHDLAFPIGQVNKYGPANFRTNGRLLQSQVRREPVGRTSVDEDLVITLTMSSEPGTVPYIPGYQLVSASAFMDRFGFRADPEGDPYQDCPVIINQKRRQTLAQAFSSIGLTELADQVKDHSRLTATELANLIRASAFYYAPNQIGNWSDDVVPKRITYIDNFDQYAQLVDNGKLRVQCSGAANFLKQSFEIAFGGGCASVVGGQVIHPNDDVINFAGHAQTVFTHKGRQYILDATPSSHLSGQTGDDITEGGDYLRPRHAANVPQLALADHAEEITVYQPKPERTVAEYTVELINSLTEQYKVTFDLGSDEMLYNYLVRLPIHDPARRTLEMLLQYQDGKLDQSQISEISDYIEHCAEASLDLRRKAGFGHYTVNFLEQLRNTAWHLKWAIEKANETKS